MQISVSLLTKLPKLCRPAAVDNVVVFGAVSPTFSLSSSSLRPGVERLRISSSLSAQLSETTCKWRPISLERVVSCDRQTPITSEKNEMTTALRTLLARTLICDRPVQWGCERHRVHCLFIWQKKRDNLWPMYRSFEAHPLKVRPETLQPLLLLLLLLL